MLEDAWGCSRILGVPWDSFTNRRNWSPIAVTNINPIEIDYRYVLSLLHHFWDFSGILNHFNGFSDFSFSFCRSCSCFNDTFDVIITSFLRDIWKILGFLREDSKLESFGYFQGKICSRWQHFLQFVRCKSIESLIWIFQGSITFSFNMES